MAVGNSTIIHDTVLLIRDLLLNSGVTDPISSKRTGNLKFIMTSYPNRNVLYPVITVRNIGFKANSAGQNTTDMWTIITTEIRIWSQSVEQRDVLSDSVFNYLRTKQTGSGGSIPGNLYDFAVSSFVPVDEEGEHGIHSGIFTVTHKFVTSNA
ncbi:MAG: hypothetical protein WC444_06785 [Candidatus Paceibacterota bacterium]